MCVCEGGGGGGGGVGLGLFTWQSATCMQSLTGSRVGTWDPWPAQPRAQPCVAHRPTLSWRLPLGCAWHENPFFVCDCSFLRLFSRQGCGTEQAGWGGERGLGLSIRAPKPQSAAPLECSKVTPTGSFAQGPACLLASLVCLALPACQLARPPARFLPFYQRAYPRLGQQVVARYTSAARNWKVILSPPNLSVASCSPLVHSDRPFPRCPQP